MYPYMQVVASSKTSNRLVKFHNVGINDKTLETKTYSFPSSLISTAQLDSKQ